VCCTRYFLSGLAALASLARGAASPTSHWSSERGHSVPNFILSPSLFVSEVVTGGLNKRHLILIILGSFLHRLLLRGRIRSSARARRLGTARGAQLLLLVACPASALRVLLRCSGLATGVNTHLLELVIQF
jgi:hypothetical protein